ncbi:MAG TPA: SprT family zinc-dependent metalloprotease [Burkholderiales bacterium]|nr:SprT family zinc-dependent metalloprotease [Burkholderiales bacterium]
MQLELPFLVELPREAQGRLRHVRLGARVVPYRFRRARRRTIGIVVDGRGLAATAPRWASIAEVEAFIREKERWILKRLDDTRRHARAPFLWQEGARLPYLGREIEIWRAMHEEPRLARDRLEVPAHATRTAESLREIVTSWLRVAALALFQERIAAFAPVLRVDAPVVGLSNAASQWGSCVRAPDGRGRVLLHWKLVHFDVPLVDYVVAHELAHLRHMNHSAAFWRLVEAVYPGHRDARRALRERGNLIPDL